MIDSIDVDSAISWLTVQLLVVATFVSAPVMSWFMQHGTGQIPEIAYLAWMGLLLITLIEYTTHLLQYNEIVRQRVKGLVNWIRQVKR